LQEFITEEALKYQEESLGVTYLLVHDKDPIAFITVSMACIEVEQLGGLKRVQGVRVPYPALLVGRLAVDKKLRGMGVGSLLCKYAVGVATGISDIIGCRYVALHTNQARANFYTRDPLNFVVCSQEKGRLLLCRRIEPVRPPESATSVA
jgi:GNAT superfamily N-acetyltransferase